MINSSRHRSEARYVMYGTINDNMINESDTRYGIGHQHTSMCCDKRAVRQKSGSSCLWSAVMLFMIAAGGSDPNQVATWPNGRVYDQARTHVIDDGSSTRGSTTIA
jgi:hypothetical protein